MSYMHVTEKRNACTKEAALSSQLITQLFHLMTSEAAQTLAKWTQTGWACWLLKIANFQDGLQGQLLR